MELVSWYIKDPLNIPALERSLTEIITRHEALRTCFPSEEGVPVQRILPPRRVRLEAEDFTHVTEENRETEISRRASEFFDQPFDLASGPLIRSLLMRLSGGYFLVIVVHHIVADGWSGGVFNRELTALYQSFANNLPSPLPPLRVQYADFAAWQRNQLSDSRANAGMEYWKRKLESAPTVLELPTDRPRKAGLVFDGASDRVFIDSSSTGRLQQTCRETGATMFMTVMTVYFILLYRYTHQQDISLGTPIANRYHKQIEPLIGFFVNLLVMRIQLTPETTFRQLLEQVKTVSLEAFAHQDIPFGNLVDSLNLERNLDHTPLFQAFFVLQNMPMGTPELPGLDVTPMGNREYTVGAAFDLTLSLTEIEGELEGRMEYNKNLFDASTIQRLAGNFHVLLRSVLETPEQPVSLLNILTNEQREQVISEWNRTERDYPEGKTLSGLFRQQCRITPDGIAVSGAAGPGITQVSYRHLHDRVSHLSYVLKRHGVVPGTVVGIMAERSVQMVIGLLAILEAGGAYMPLDPDYPADRLRFMLRDSDTALVITTAGLVSDVSMGMPEEIEAPLLTPEDFSGVQRIELLENLFEQGAGAGSLSTQYSDTNPAYVIYTSGSTGRPKGAIVSHRSICNRLFWMQEYFRLTVRDRVIQKTPFSFDVSVWEFFWPLLKGAQLVMAKPGGHKDNDYLRDAMVAHGITTTHFVPGMLSIFLGTPGIAAIASLTRVICSGEALPMEYAERFYETFKDGAQLFNLYGPTEAAVDVSVFHCKPGEDIPGSGSVPIGKPISNTQLYVLDPNMNPVPVGVQGELYISGVQLAKGYLNRPELTSESFISEKFLRGSRGAFFQKSPPGRRRHAFYKTGDVVYLLPDGNIRFLGRTITRLSCVVSGLNRGRSKMFWGGLQESRRAL